MVFGCKNFRSEDSVYNGYCTLEEFQKENKKIWDWEDGSEMEFVRMNAVRVRQTWELGDLWETHSDE
jgi:hypothetical protein